MFQCGWSLKYYPKYQTKGLKILFSGQSLVQIHMDQGYSAHEIAQLRL